MSRLDELYKLTIDLEATLNQEITNNNRESIITKINDLVDKRGIAMQEIQPPFTETENETGQKVIKLNETIEQKLEAVFSQLKEEMKQMQKRKKSNRSYINPYGKMKTIDGVYLDSKQ